MRFRDDNRAQSVQIGAILLFATLVIALSIYQATVVPSQNADIEYKHSQAVQNQMTDVRNGLLRTAATGNAQPVSVTLGTQYPSRVFLMNPPPATGTLRTGSYDDSTIRVSNVDATNEETRDFLNGNWTASTKYLEYEPNYHEYDNAPNLLYEASVLSNFYPNTNNGTAIPLTEQLLVDNETRTITLVTLNGSLSTTRASSVTVSPETLSAPYQRVQVQPNQTGEPVNVSVPTRLSASQLESRTDLGSHPGVIDVVDASGDLVVVQVNWTGQFILQTARLGVGSGTENPEPYYLTLVENRGDRVTVEARDRFNNAESGVTVSVNDTLGSDPFYESSKQTDENGQATFEVQESGQRDATLEIGSAVYEQVNVTVQRTRTGGGGGGATPTPSISLRVDDLTQVRSNQGVFIGSYNLTNTNSSFERVAVRFQNQDNTFQSETINQTSTQAGVRYAGGQSGHDYEVVFDVIYSNSNGDDYVVASETITDTADAQNPSGNVDLGTGSTASFTSWEIRDQTQVNNNQVRYRASYDVTPGGSFSEVRGYALNLNGNGGSAVRTFNNRNQNNQDIQPGDGANTQYRVGLLVRDANGTVVDVVSVTDTADGTGP